MLIKRVSILLVALTTSAVAFAAGPSDVHIRTTRPGATATIEWSVAEGKALVSVVDAKQDPVLGLTAKDFEVARAGAAAKVGSVQPIAQSVEVPRHVVLVLDNSYSMVERKLVKQLLDGVGSVLKHIRPIDDVRIVVFHDKPTVKMGGHDLHVEVFKSSNPSELGEFVAKAYSKGHITDSTYLYEAMVAGLDLVRGMPTDGPRFLAVFSDGEDLNSAFKSDVVDQAAQGLGNLHVFAIDYLPKPEIDQFLAKFASENHGQARKAGTGADLLMLFQQFASRLEPYYIVSYEFMPEAAPKAAAPAPAAPAVVAPEPTAAPAAPAPATAVAPTPETPTVPAPAPAPAPPAGCSSTTIIIIVVIVVVIVLIFLATRKKDKKN
jgi:hypothetical protein